jgi:hypothetical protein
MSSVILSGDTSGAITLTAPAVAGTNTATLPAATGTVMVSGNMPAFRAYASAGTVISVGGTSKITFDTEDFDTNNNFASNRFTPTVAGYYQISIGVRPTSSTIQETAVYLYKNSSSYQTLYDASIVLYNFSSSTLIYMNGSSDYIEVYMYSQLGGTTDFGAGAVWFSGVLVRGA